jgi:hypothetical protein
MDVGYTNDPSEILVFSEENDKAQEGSKLKLVTRIHLERISHGDQVAVILWLLDFYQPLAFSLDKTGLGLPLFQDIQERSRADIRIKNLSDRIKGYNFSAKILVDFDDSIAFDENKDDLIKTSGVERNVLEHASDRLRDLVDNKRIILPWDKELIGEFQGQTWTFDKSKMDMYGRKKLYSKGEYHALDAARMAVLGWSQDVIEEMTRGLSKHTFTPTPTVFLY